MEQQLPEHSEDFFDDRQEPYSGSELLQLIWTHPRKVIRYLLVYEPTKYVTVLLLLHGISETFLRMQDKNAGDSWSLTGIIGVAFIMGPLGGLFSAFVSSALLSLSGGWLQGKADAEQIRIVIAWTSIPTISLLLVLPIEMSLFGVELFQKEQPTMEDHPILVELFDSVFAILALWRIGLLVIGISEVQGFSIWKAVLNCILAALIILVPIGLIILLLKLFF